MLTPIEGKLLMMGIDVASDIIMDIYFQMQSKGKDTITADEILAMANKWKVLKDAEVNKIEERMEARAAEADNQ